MNDDNLSDLSKIERLSVILMDDGRSVDEMDSAQLDQYVNELGIEMSAPNNRLNQMLKRARARQALENARRRRLAATERAESLISSGKDAIEKARLRLDSMIQKLKERDPDQAMVYAREFEKTTPEDYETLAEDMMLLDLGEVEDAEGNQ